MYSEQTQFCVLIRIIIIIISERRNRGKAAIKRPSKAEIFQTPITHLQIAHVFRLREATCVLPCLPPKSKEKKIKRDC